MVYRLVVLVSLPLNSGRLTCITKQKGKIEMGNGFFTISKGSMVYLDSLSGLVKAKVTSVEGGGRVIATVTGNTRTYKRGETVISDNVRILLRTQIFKFNGQIGVYSAPCIAIPDAVIDGTAQWNLSEFLEHALKNVYAF